jgi:hypothetical protein
VRDPLCKRSERVGRRGAALLGLDLGQPFGQRAVDERVGIAASTRRRGAGVCSTLAIMASAILAGSPNGGWGSVRMPRVVAAGVSS